MLSDDAVDAIRILERAAQLLVFLDELGMFLLFVYLVDGDLQLAKLFRRIVKGDDVLWDRQDTAKPRLLKLHTARHIALEHLVCHVAPVVRVANGCGGEADDLRFGIAFNLSLIHIYPAPRARRILQFEPICMLPHHPHKAKSCASSSLRVTRTSARRCEPR